MFASSCATVGQRSSDCGVNDVAHRFTLDQIDHMSDAQVTEMLAYNEALEKRGCAVANPE
jgi:hypothetical protein